MAVRSFAAARGYIVEHFGSGALVTVNGGVSNNGDVEINNAVRAATPAGVYECVVEPDVFAKYDKTGVWPGHVGEMRLQQSDVV